MEEFNNNNKVIRLQQLETALHGMLKGVFGRGIEGGPPKTCPADRVIASLRAEIELINYYFNEMK